MSNFLDALSSAARSGACTVLGSSEYINDALQRIGFFPFEEARQAIPNFWRNALCDTPAPPAPPPPFTGGQCECEGYTVTFSRVFANGGGSDQPTTQPFPGPIRGLRQAQEGGATVLYLSHGLCSGSEYFGQTESQVSSSGPLDSFGIVSVQKVSGADVCGNPPPTIAPPAPEDVTVPRDVTYEDSNGVNITIPVVFVYARADIDATANITIPFTANINGELNVTGNINLDGTVEINIGTAGGTGSPKDPRKDPCDDIALPVETPPEDPTEADQPDNPDREDEENIIGVLVTVTSLENERASTIVQVENPDIYVPSLGHVNFLCRVGTTQAGWTTDIQVKNRRHLIQCPWDLGAIAVRGTPQPGVTWELTPVYGYAGRPVEYVQ